MVTAGLGYGQLMKVSDWIILAEGARIEEDYIPLSAPISAPAAAPSAPAVATPQIPAQTYPNGSKFRWTLNAETYRIAIQTDKGVLQVKSVTDGAGECHENCFCTPCKEFRMVPRAPWVTRLPLTKKMFADFAAWEASLPKTGHIIRETPEKKDDISGLAKLQDHEKINALLKRYKIRSREIVQDSPNQALQRAVAYVQNFREQLTKIPLDDPMSSHLMRDSIRQLKWAIKNHATKKLQAQTSSNPDKNTILIQKRGTGTLIATINNVSYSVFAHNNMIALAANQRGYNVATLYPNFAAMGKPTFSLHYRRRTIDLTL
jgi:hypothetical protein